MLEILIGLPGSGKSAYAKEKELEEDNVVVVSSDSIRKEILGDVNDQSQNDKVFSVLLKKCLEGVRDNKRVIVDATNLNRKRRINFINEFPMGTKIIATVFAIPFSICCERNNNRERTVPLEIMERMYRTFTPPTREEGYSDIALVMEDEIPKEDRIESIEAINMKTPHDNPYHSLTCGEHCLETEKTMEKLLEEKGIDDEIEKKVLLAAARYHDLSKYKCKGFKSETEVASFYNHANVSAYDFLSNYCYLSEILRANCFYIANLIASHMVFYNGAAATRKQRHFFNGLFWEDLFLLHLADKMAH